MGRRPHARLAEARTDLSRHRLVPLPESPIGRMLSHIAKSSNGASVRLSKIMAWQTDVGSRTLQPDRHLP